MTIDIKKRAEFILKHNAGALATYRAVAGFGLRTLGLFEKVEDNLVLFTAQAKKFNDSPRAIYMYMLEHGLTEKYRCVWAVDDINKYDIPGNAEVIVMDTLEYFKTALKAKYWVCSVNIERGLNFKKKNQVFLNTWHGAAINVCGNGVGTRNDFHWDYIDHFCVCGKCDEINFGRDLELNPASFLRVGLPRNDALYSYSKEDQISIKEKLGLPKEKKAILYAPTWRDSEDGGTSYNLAPPIDWDKWKNELGDEYVVMLRTHPYTTQLMNVRFDNFVINFTEYPEVNDLLIAADILVSDYSSINLDYCLTGKPMICFGYDYDDYKNSRGFYYDLEKEMPNGVMRTENEVISHLKHLDYKADEERTALFRSQHCEYGNGNATAECVKALFGI